jgi:hypothetical protein
MVGMRGTVTRRCAKTLAGSPEAAVPWVQRIGMFIDDRVWRPPPGGGDPDEKPQRREYDIPWSGIGWTLVVAWLFIASWVTSSGLLAAGLAYTGVLIAIWRGVGWLGRNSTGMRDHRQ